MITTDYQEFLLKTRQNLEVLREREAKYGGNAPLDLHNQIEDHKRAIILTQQAIDGEIDETEWQEAIQPLNLSLPRTTNIFQIFVQSVPLPYAIGVGIVLMIILGVGVAILMKIPTPVPVSLYFGKVLSGQVQDDITEEIIKAATIQVGCNLGSEQVLSTDENGKFEFEVVCKRPAGTANTVVKANGYWEITTKFDMVPDSPPDLIKQNFRLIPNTHTVKYGETLASIGRRYGVSPNAIAQVNSNISQVSPGQVINIPNDTAATPTPPAPDTPFEARLVTSYEGATIETAKATDMRISWSHADPEVDEITLNISLFRATCTFDSNSDQCEPIWQRVERTSYPIQGAGARGTQNVLDIPDLFCPDLTTYDPYQVTYGVQFDLEARKDGLPANPESSNRMDVLCSPPTSEFANGDQDN